MIYDFGKIMCDIPFGQQSSRTCQKVIRLSVSKHSGV